MTFRSWLQLFRFQTAPATLLLLLTPFLNNFPLFSLTTIMLAGLCLLIHSWSFGQNSLMDYAMGYDSKDLHKRHHPLISGAIKQAAAHNVIHWGLGILTVAAAGVTLLLSPAAALAMFFLIGWVAFGHAYNDGLSKECLFGSLAISLAITCAGAWGWLLSHESLSALGMLYLGYVFFTILYQTSWSGFVKEMQVGEKSNIIAKMGAHLDVNRKGPKQFIPGYLDFRRTTNQKRFIPGKARFYAWFVKGSNLLFGVFLLWLQFTLVRLVIFVILVIPIAFYLTKTTKPRPYNRPKELMQMSMMEILTIYLPIPMLLAPLEAFLLMVGGIIYFFAINKVLWNTPYPKV